MKWEVSHKCLFISTRRRRRTISLGWNALTGWWPMETWKLKGRSLPFVVLLLSWPRQGDIISLYSCVKWPYPILILHFTPSRGKPFGDSLVLLTRGTHFWFLKGSSSLEDMGMCIRMGVPTTGVYMWTLHCYVTSCTPSNKCSGNCNIMIDRAMWFQDWTVKFWNEGPLVNWKDEYTAFILWIRHGMMIFVCVSKHGDVFHWGTHMYRIG